MTQREKFTVCGKRNELLFKYLEFCETLNEVPRKEIYLSMNSITDVKTIDELKANLDGKIETFLKETK